MVGFLKEDKYWWFFALLGTGCFFLPYIMVKYFEGSVSADNRLEAIFIVLTPPFGLLMLMSGVLKAYTHFRTKTTN